MKKLVYHPRIVNNKQYPIQEVLIDLDDGSDPLLTNQVAASYIDDLETALDHHIRECFEMVGDIEKLTVRLKKSNKTLQFGYLIYVVFCVSIIIIDIIQSF